MSKPILLRDLVIQTLADPESGSFTAREIARRWGEDETRVLEYLRGFKKRGLLTSVVILPPRLTRKRRPYEVFHPVAAALHKFLESNAARARDGP
jgi:hypothetical protein